VVAGADLKKGNKISAGGGDEPSVHDIKVSISQGEARPSGGEDEARQSEELGY